MLSPQLAILRTLCNIVDLWFMPNPELSGTLPSARPLTAPPAGYSLFTISATHLYGCCCYPQIAWWTIY